MGWNAERKNNHFHFGLTFSFFFVIFWIFFTKNCDRILFFDLMSKENHWHKSERKSVIEIVAFLVSGNI